MQEGFVSPVEFVKIKNNAAAWRGKEASFVKKSEILVEKFELNP